MNFIELLKYIKFVSKNDSKQEHANQSLIDTDNAASVEVCEIKEAIQKHLSNNSKLAIIEIADAAT